MDFELPEELRILKAGLRRFVDEELIPIERQTTDGEKLKPEYLARFEQRAKDLGIWQTRRARRNTAAAAWPILARVGRMGGALAHHRAAGARRGHHRPVRTRRFSILSPAR